MWEVGRDLESGRLVQVLEDYAAPPMGIYAVFRHYRPLPLRLRLFVDQLKSAYSDQAYWCSSKK